MTTELPDGFVRVKPTKQRRRGTGTVYLPKGAKSWWIRYYSAGKPVYENTHKATRAGAQNVLNERLAALSKGAKIDTAPGKVTFNDALKCYRDSLAKNGKTERRGIAKNLVPCFTGRKLIAISHAMIDDYITARQKTAKPATINRELAVLRKAFRLIRKDHPSLNLPTIENLEENNVRKGFFEQHQFESVCALLKPAIRAVVTFAFLTSWRKAEVLGLTWDRVDLGEGTISLNPGETKNDEGRVIYLTRDLRTLLEAQDVEHRALLKRGVICPFVFNRNGKAIKDYYGAWRTATKLAGCPGRIPHDMRRSAIRTFTRRGISEAVAMRMSGHKTRSVFDRYNIVSGDDLKRAAALLDENGVNYGVNRDERSARSQR